MGAAIMRGAIAAGVVGADDVLVVEPDESRRRALAALGCATSDDPASARGASIILLAVKPQTFPQVVASMGAPARSTVVISIMAGISSGAIRAALGTHARVIRAMPNTPCQIGLGMTAIAIGDGAVAGDEIEARRIFDAVGATALVDESMIDAVTAVSGSGPAYVFHLAEAMEEAARSLGFPPGDARTFVRQTIVGAAGLLARDDADPAALRSAVTSKGGTTEAAVRVLDDAHVREAVVRALTAARDRARELAGGASPTK